MKISEAKKRITMQRIVSAIVVLVALIFLVCAALKSIYLTLQGDMTAFSSVSRGIQRLVYVIYERTQFVSWFWEWAPILSPKDLNTTGNWGGLFIMTCGFIGRVMWDSASHLSLRVKKTIQRVEELGWERELMGQSGQISGGKPDVLQINIDLDQKDQWYKRPIGLLLLGVAIAVLGQWANLHFGLVNP
jgi:hypothetical protein